MSCESSARNTNIHTSNSFFDKCSFGRTNNDDAVWRLEFRVQGSQFKRLIFYIRLFPFFRFEFVFSLFFLSFFFHLLSHLDRKCYLIFLSTRYFTFDDSLNNVNFSLNYSSFCQFKQKNLSTWTHPSNFSKFLAKSSCRIDTDCKFIHFSLINNIL